MKTITTEQLRQKLEGMEDVTLINTLPASNFEETKIEQAINIPLERPDFVDRVGSAVSQNRDAEIVVYCASDRCDSSTQAAEKLDEAGFTHVYDYDGGAKEWNQMHPS